jgi:hypothetical protein
MYRLGNVIYAVYDAPITLSMVKVYNYSKTPARGAREIEIYIDDLKVRALTNLLPLHHIYILIELSIYIYICIGVHGNPS